MTKKLSMVIGCGLVGICVAADIRLPPPATGDGKPLMETLATRKSSRAYGDREPDATVLSSLLWAADGINRSDGRRTAPTGLNVQDVDIYVMLKSGVYRYDAKENVLAEIATGDFRTTAGRQEFARKAPVNLFYVQDTAKAMKSDAASGWRFAGIHAGAIMQNVYLFCASAGLATVARASIDAESLAKALKLAPNQRVILGQTVGYSPDAAHGCPPGPAVAETLSDAVAKDLEKPVRAGGVAGRPFWNRYSVQFLYPPAFDFVEVKGAAKYRFTVTDDILNEHVFVAARPTADLSPVWKDVPVGYARVTVEGVGADGTVCGTAGTRRFWRSAPFVPPRAWGYGESAKRYYAYLFNQPNTVHFREQGTPDADGSLDLPVIYPSKMNSTLIQAMLRYAKLAPERREAAILTARRVADYMLSISQSAEAPLANFPPTYWKKPNQRTNFASQRYAGQNMLIYPAWMGDAYLDLWTATGETKYRDAALAIAATFERIQCSNGSWYVKIWERDGKPVIEGGRTEPYYIIPTDIYFFLMHVARITGDARWRRVADRAFAYLEKGPMTTYDWAAQYEDTPPSKDYIGHSGDMAADAALILLERFPKDAARIEQARELMRWIEDQFVFWKRPCRSDKRGILSEKHEAFSPVWNGSHPKYSFDNWRDVPVSTEKYHYSVPINSKTAKVMRLFLKMYQTTGDRLCLEKAKALGDGIVKVQASVGTGNIPTHFYVTDCRNDCGESDWTNCGVFTALGLEELSAGVRE